MGEAAADLLRGLFVMGLFTFKERLGLRGMLGGGELREIAPTDPFRVCVVPIDAALLPIEAIMDEMFGVLLRLPQLKVRSGGARRGEPTLSRFSNDEPLLWRSRPSPPWA